MFAYTVPLIEHVTKLWTKLSGKTDRHVFLKSYFMPYSMHNYKLLNHERHTENHDITFLEAELRKNVGVSLICSSCKHRRETNSL